MLTTPSPRRKPEPTIALINVVFLMLIFFLVAGTLAAPLDPQLTLVRTVDLAAAPPPDALVLSGEGDLSFRGAPADPAEYVAHLDEDQRARLRLVPDRDVPASRMMQVASALRAAGAGEVVIIAERELK